MSCHLHICNKQHVGLAASYLKHHTSTERKIARHSQAHCLYALAGQLPPCIGSVHAVLFEAKVAEDAREQHVAWDGDAGPVPEETFGIVRSAANPDVHDGI